MRLSKLQMLKPLFAIVAKPRELSALIAERRRVWMLNTVSTVAKRIPIRGRAISRSTELKHQAAVIEQELKTITLLQEVERSDLQECVEPTRTIQSLLNFVESR
jgi:hypothetical protein